MRYRPRCRRSGNTDSSVTSRSNRARSCSTEGDCTAGEREPGFADGSGTACSPPPGSPLDQPKAVSLSPFPTPGPRPLVDELVRVTRPGGEIAIYTSVTTPVSQLPGVETIGKLAGFHFFGRHEITDRLRAAGVTRMEHTIVDQGQFVLATKDQS